MENNFNDLGDDLAEALEVVRHNIGGDPYSPDDPMLEDDLEAIRNSAYPAQEYSNNFNYVPETPTFWKENQVETLCTDQESEYYQNCMGYHQPFLDYTGAVTPDVSNYCSDPYQPIFQSNEIQKEEPLSPVFTTPVIEAPVIEVPVIGTPVVEQSLANNFEKIKLKSPTPVPDNNTIENTVCITHRTIAEKKSRHDEKKTEIKRVRAKKIDIQKMTEDEKERKKKEGNRKNTRNYNERKREELKNLETDVANLETKLVNSGKSFETADEYLNIARDMVLKAENNETSHLKRVDDYLCAYKFSKISIQDEAVKTKRADPELHKLQKSLKEKEAAFEVASNDIKLKNANINTFGSKKSRAKEAMKKCSLECKIAGLQYDLKIVEKMKKEMNECKKNILPYYSDALKQKELACWRIYFDKIYEVRNFFETSKN